MADRPTAGPDAPADRPAPGGSDELAEPEPDQPSRMSFGQHAWAFTRELVAVVVGAVIVAAVLRAFVGQMFLIPSISMQNTLQVSDRVVVEKISSVKRGQVVVFADPGGWLSGPSDHPRGPVGQILEFVGILPDTGTEHLIKRVVGMPGDHVVCCDPHGRIQVNGQSLDETAYLYRDPAGRQAKPSTMRFDVIVPADRIFVLGDNRAQSRDSRCHLADVQPGGLKGDNAFVSLDLVVGHAVAVVWPLADLSRLSVPSTFEAVPSGKMPPPPQATVTAGSEASC